MMYATETESRNASSQNSHRVDRFQRSVITAFVFLLFLAPAARAQTLQNRADQIRAAMDARDFTRAEELVRALRAAEASAFNDNNYDYLLARLAERRGAYAEAQTLYLALLQRGSIVAPYALWHLAVIARASEDFSLERQYLTRLIASYPSSALAPRARERKIESHRESGDDRATIALLKPVASAVGLRGRSALARLGEAYAKIGDFAGAREAFEQLIAGSRDDYALQAALGLDALDRSQRIKPGEFDALRRARIFLTNRHWEEARGHLSDIVERFPESANRPEALYQVGFTLYRQDRQQEAVRWFERAHSEFPSRREGEQGYYWVATALQKARRYDEAAKRYSDFIEAYPDSDLIEGAYRNVVDCLRYAGKDVEAIQASRDIVSKYSRQPLAAVGLFNEARVELSRGNWATAFTLLTRLQGQPSAPKLLSAPMRGEAAFLRIYALEKMGRLGEAARLYLALPDDRDNYFGQQATVRLRSFRANEAGRRVIDQLVHEYRQQARAALAAGRAGEAKAAAKQALRLVADSESGRDLLDILRSSYSSLPGYNALARFRLMPAGRDVIRSGNAAGEGSHKTLAAELLFLGLYDEGCTELRLAGSSGLRSHGSGEPGLSADEVTDSAAGDVAYSMAVYSNRGEHSHYAIQFAEPLFRSVPQDYQLELLPRDLAELMYPAPYRDVLNRYASKLGIDPRLVLALARQESRFDPSVKSPASARGLLQFIPETGEKLAAEEGLKDFELDDVYNPEIAVRLAVRYVSDLLRLFPNNPYAVAAAYNTGEQNVERWIFRARSQDNDCFVGEIAIPETKDYVAKVMTNYRAYQRLYTQDLKPNRN